MNVERDHERGGRFVVPAGLLLSLVTFFPIVYVVALSLQRRSLLGEPNRFVGLDNYLRMAADPRFWNALGNTA